MRNHSDQPIYRTFEEFEREELRRADAVNNSVDNLFDDQLTEDLDFDDRPHQAADYSDDEE